MKISLKHIAITKQADGDVSSMLQQGGRRFLLNLKQKSIRTNNIWFRTLSIDKRRYIDAVIQTLDKIKSPLILKILTPLARKLIQALGGTSGLLGKLAYGIQSFGQPQAQKISKIAYSWGNKKALSWANETGFMRFLVVIDMNDLPIFKVSTKL
jgi:hypothetical protein